MRFPCSRVHDDVVPPIAAVSAVVEQLGECMDIRSQLGRGKQARVRLPLVVP